MGLYHFARWLNGMRRCGENPQRIITLHRRERCLTSLQARVSVDPDDGSSHRGEDTMVWKTPEIVEIALGMEINAYACAEIG